MMLGALLNELADPMQAEAAIAAIARPDLLERVRSQSEAARTPIGTLVAAKMRQVIDGSGEDLWVDLLGVMSSSPTPGIAAVERMLSRAFPDPVRVRITRSA